MSASAKPSQEPTTLPLADSGDDRLIGFDSDTFLPNRRYFDHQIKAEWSRCARHQRPIALVLVQVDHHDNETRLAEQCKTIAYALDTESRRGADLIFRLTADSFAIVLVETAFDDAVTVARRMQSRIRSLGLPVPDGADKDSRTCSFAVIGCDNQNRDTQMTDWLKQSWDAGKALKGKKHERLISRTV